MEKLQIARKPERIKYQTSVISDLSFRFSKNIADIIEMTAEREKYSQRTIQKSLQKAREQCELLLAMIAELRQEI